MFYTTKNRNKDLVRRIRRALKKSNGPSPSRKRKIKKRQKISRRHRTKRAANSEFHQTRCVVAEQINVRNRDKAIDPINAFRNDLSRDYCESLAATIIQGAWRRDQVAKRVYNRRYRALAEEVKPLKGLECDIQMLMDFVNSPFAHLVDCSPLRSQKDFLYRRLTEVNFSPVPTSGSSGSVGQLWDESIQSAKRCLAMLTEIQIRINDVVETRSIHQRPLREEIKFLEKVNVGQARMIRRLEKEMVEKDKAIAEKDRIINRYKISIYSLVKMIPDPSDEFPPTEYNDYYDEPPPFEEEDHIPAAPPPSPVSSPINYDSDKC